MYSMYSTFDSQTDSGHRWLKSKLNRTTGRELNYTHGFLNHRRVFLALAGFFSLSWGFVLILRGFIFFDGF
jgi:hypothetical protein